MPVKPSTDEDVPLHVCIALCFSETITHAASHNLMNIKWFHHTSWLRCYRIKEMNHPRVPCHVEFDFWFFRSASSITQLWRQYCPMMSMRPRIRVHANRADTLTSTILTLSKMEIIIKTACNGNLRKAAMRANRGVFSMLPFAFVYLQLLSSLSLSHFFSIPFSLLNGLPCLAISGGSQLFYWKR